ncbi:MAG: hypothetical protein F6J87_01020 [Spirulina sp. SIO3F2]|nr:hypothetical protein [Spirulina sp. SIO3F2]
MRRSSGFTVWELICVVSILTILFIVLVVPNIMLPRCVYARRDPEHESKTRWLLMLQRSYRLEFGEFAKSIQELQHEDPELSGLVKDSEEHGAYQLSMEVKDNLVTTYATPKSTVKNKYRIHSYAKAGIWDESKNKWGQYVACKTQRPTMKRIETPMVRNGLLTCGDDSLEKLCEKGKWPQWFKSRIMLFFSKR